MASLIYLASPYSHLDPDIRHIRYTAAKLYTARHIQLGFAMFSPIVYGKQMEEKIGTDYKSWQTFNDSMIKASCQIWVLMLNGWKDSLGVEHECKYALDLGKPLHFIAP